MSLFSFLGYFLDFILQYLPSNFFISVDIFLISRSTFYSDSFSEHHCFWHVMSCITGDINYRSLGVFFFLSLGFLFFQNCMFPLSSTFLMILASPFHFGRLSSNVLCLWTTGGTSPAEGCRAILPSCLGGLNHRGQWLMLGSLFRM